MLFDDQKSCGRKAVRLAGNRERLRRLAAVPPIGGTARKVFPGRDGLATPVVPRDEPAGMPAIMPSRKNVRAVPRRETAAKRRK